MEDLLKGLRGDLRNPEGIAIPKKVWADPLQVLEYSQYDGTQISPGVMDDHLKQNSQSLLSGEKLKSRRKRF